MPCRHCHRGHEHPAHAFFECNAGRLPELRELLFENAPTTWERLLTKIETAIRTEYRNPDYSNSQHRAAVAAAYNDPSRYTEAQWLTHRLLWALPWPASAIPSGLGAAAAHSLGSLFDSTTLSRHALRPLADSWISWSAKWTEMFGAAWGTLNRELASANASDQDPPITHLHGLKPDADNLSNPTQTTASTCTTTSLNDLTATDTINTRRVGTTGGRRHPITTNIENETDQ